LDKRGIKYEKLDVIADAMACKEMVKLSGQELAPVIDANQSQTKSICDN
jgi:hypothetical protein